MLLVFLHEMHRSKVTETKTALKRVNCNNVQAKRISFDNLSWGLLDLDFKIRISDLQPNARSENGFQRRGIRFWIFIFTSLEYP